MLRPNGVLAIFGGRRPEIGTDPKVDKVIVDLMVGDDYFGPVFDKRAFLANEEYASLKIDGALFSEDQRLQLPDYTDLSVDQIVNPPTTPPLPQHTGCGAVAYKV